MRTATLIAVAMLASGAAIADLPKKCVMEDGSISYGTHRQCPGGHRERIDGGSFSAVRSQAIEVYEPEYRKIRVYKDAVAPKDGPPRPTITEQIR